MGQINSAVWSAIRARDFPRHVLCLLNALKMVVGYMLLLVCSLMLQAQGAPTPPKYVERFIVQAVDHFNYELQDSFMERYLLSGKFTLLDSSNKGGRSWYY